MAVTRKTLLVLARRDHAEGMRVAAGLTILGHEVHLVMMSKPVEENEETIAQAELLELADIVPRTTVSGEDLDKLDARELAHLIARADSIVNL